MDLPLWHCLWAGWVGARRQCELLQAGCALLHCVAVHSATLRTSPTCPLQLLPTVQAAAWKACSSSGWQPTSYLRTACWCVGSQCQVWPAQKATPLADSQPRHIAQLVQDTTRQQLVAAARSIDTAFAGSSQVSRSQACFEVMQRFATRQVLPYVSAPDALLAHAAGPAPGIVCMPI